jgi:hypothetical protein
MQANWNESIIRGNPYYIIGLYIMKYTEKQIIQFKSFCIRHDISFNTIAEYHSALSQYYTGE